MLNKFNTEKAQPAKVHYLASDFEVIAHGNHVLCAVTNKVIPLDELKYWSWERQEAYIDAAASLKAEQQAGNLS